MNAPAPAGGPDGLAAVLTEIEEVLSSSRRMIDEFLGAAGTVLDQLPAIIAGGAFAALQQLQELRDQVIVRIAELLAQAGSPAALRAAGAVWTGAVGGRVSALASAATLDASMLDDHWQGRAADAYAKMLPRQQAALTAIKAGTDQVQKVLDQMAAAITAFWNDILVAAIALGASLAALLAASIPVVTLPATITLAVLALAAFLTAVGSAWSAFSDLSDAASAQSVELQQGLTSNAAFEAGAWPRSTSELSDAALLDGDGTDYRLRVS